MSDLVIGDIPVFFENMTNEIAFLKQELAELKKAEIIEQPVDIKQAAEFLHIARQTLYQWVCKRKIPFINRVEYCFSIKVSLINGYVKVIWAR